MQDLLVIPVTNDDKDLLRILADQYCVAILQATDKVFKSASQLSSECGIFTSIVYRRLKSLQKSGLLDTYYEIRPDGKKFFLYKSLVKHITVSFSDNKLEVNLALKTNEISLHENN